MSILDRIRGAQPQQKGIEKLLKAKGGKAGAVTSPAQSSLGEGAAISQTQQAGREQTFAERLQQTKIAGAQKGLADQTALGKQKLGQQGEMFQQKLAVDAETRRAEIENRERESRLARESKRQTTTAKLNNTAELQLRDLASTRNTTVDNIFAEYESSTAELEDRKDAAKLEELSFNLALQDRKYTRQLEKIGIQRNLSDSLAHDTETQNLVFGHALSSTLTDLGFKTREDAKDRAFQEQLANINIDAALAILMADIQASNSMAQIEGLTTVVKESTDYALDDKKKVP